MKRQILISLLALVSATGLAGAANMPLYGFSDSLLDSSDVYKQNELIVRFADPDSAAQVATGPWSTQTVRSMMSSSIIPGAEVKRVYDGIKSGLSVVKLPQGTSVFSALARFNGSGNVVYAEPNYKYRLFLVPNDPNYPEQWALDNTGQTGGTPDADIDADQAWDITTGNPEIVIAVVDSGIDYEHPDLKDNMWVNQAELNGAPDVDDDGNGYVDDIYGYDFAGASFARVDDGDSDPNDTRYHGTHVAGIAGAVGDNAVGVTGLCWDVSLMALKIVADDGSAVGGFVLTSDAIEAIYYAVDNGARIINASWGGSEFSQAMYDAIKKADDAGLLFVAAAGNASNNNDINPVYPASYDLDNIISVMSTDHDDKPAPFSNFGAASVDIAEPGDQILSTTPRVEQFPMMVFGVPTNYAILSGTSLSAPYASAACALIWSEFPTLPNSLIKGVLLKSSEPIDSDSRCCVSNGRINMYNALTLIPKGKAGKVLNAKDDPTDLANLYDTIQDAIDDANDGDVLIAEANALFIEAIDFKGKAITLRSGDITDPNDQSLSPHNTLLVGILDPGPVVTFASGEGPDTIIRGMNISWGSGDYGAGISCFESSPTIEDCIITNNFADLYGAGIDCYKAAPIIRNCTITGNQTLGKAGIGAGINCEQASPVIANCLISNNVTTNVGGGIACFESQPTIFNCVIANNSAVFGGGGIDLDHSSPVIANCTIIVDDPNVPKDGGISSKHNSFPTVTNCILWGNGDDLYNTSATYSCIEDNDPGQGNIRIEPTFTTGPFGDYYLSQKAAGQLVDSSCIDVGNADANPDLRIDTYTTRTDGVPDSDALDMGAHYPAIPAEPIELDITIVDANEPVDPNLANGTVEPESGSFRKFEIVKLIAHPKEGYRVKAWTGTDDDSSTANVNYVTMLADAEVTVEFEQVPLYRLRTEVIGGRGTVKPYLKRGELFPDGTVVTVIAIADRNYIVDRWSGTDDDTTWASTNTVTIDSDRDVTVQFRQPKTLLVPGQFSTISGAIEGAHRHGDTIVISPGEYPGGYDPNGKAITIVSERPDDPRSVAATIIRTAPGSPAFIFQRGEGNESVVDGFTIVGQGDPGNDISLVGLPIVPDGIGTPGDPALGGAITCLNGSSPTLAHLVFRDVVARGGDGENNAEILPAPDPPPDPLDPLDPNDPLPPPEVPDPNDPNQWAPEDPNRPDQPDPNDPNATAPGFDGQDGADGLPGEPGMDGLDGLAGLPGGDGGAGYGGAMYFDANSSPVILNCTFIDCMAIGGNGGFGGQGQEGGDGQNGQPGQDGQEGQEGGEGLNDGEQGAGGAGGNGGDGGPGGNGGRGGDGGKGGQGGQALGGAIYFGANCTPTMQFCRIINCSTRQGLGNRGGNAGNGGNGGAGAEPGEGAEGGDGNPAGADGEDGAAGPGGSGGDGGTGGDMSLNGLKSWAGAIYFGENCQPDISDIVITDNAATTVLPFYAFIGGNGGNGGNGGDGEADAPGGNGGNGGDGGAGGPDPLLDPNDANDPNVSTPGLGGEAGEPGDGGEPGAPGLNGIILDSRAFTSGLGGANYYEMGCSIQISDCVFHNNTTRRHSSVFGGDGGAEYYQSDCTTVLDRIDFRGNQAASTGRGGAQFFNPFVSIEINDCNYADNAAGRDGGGISCVSDCALSIRDSSFAGNVSVVSETSVTRGGAVFAGGVWDPNELRWHNGGNLNIEESFFGSNRAAFGGGIAWQGEAAISITESVLSNNTAEHGGAMFWTSSAPVITDCSFTGNRAEARWFRPDDLISRQSTFFSTFGGAIGDASRGGGGAIFCWSSDAAIENSVFTGNSSGGSAGAVFLGGSPSTPSLHNCLVRGNSSVLDGGGVTSYWQTSPTISNCTIVDNKTNDPDNPRRGRGGGLSCSYESRTTLTNSILWNNTGTNGNQIAIGSDDEPIFLDRPAALTVSYSIVQGGRSIEAIYTEPGRILNWLDGNLDADPLFAVSAFLSPDSPAIDAGSDPASQFGLDDLTTRTDGATDTGIVDMGFHYPISTIPGNRHLLTVRIIGDGGAVEVFGKGGTRTADGWLFDKFTVVKLIADVETGYELRWIGTDNDGTNAPRNTVTMDSDKTVALEFIKSVGQTVTVPDNFKTIQEAVNHALDGDTIIVEPGRHSGGIDGASLVVDKALTITSRNPGDPTVVSATVIDGLAGTITTPNGGVIFTSNVTSKTILDGITIQNCGGELPDGGDGDRDDGHPNGFDGRPGEGAAIRIEPGASPIIRNCIIRDNQLEAGDGGNGADGGDDPPTHAGRGGWGGWALGGAIWCGPNSSPRFINCIIENNVAIGGSGGAGGAGGDGGGSGNYGGNYSASQATYYDPFSLDTDVVENLWEAMIWDYAPIYGPIYNKPNLTSFLGPPRRYSAYGGGVYCDIGSKVSFEDCEIRGNRTFGGTMGTGGAVGEDDDVVGSIEPVVAFELPTFGGGVYCAGDSVVTFTGCTFEDNATSEILAGVDPNNRADPYVGSGGGVAAEDSATVVFADCNFVDNQADSGGGLYLGDAEGIIIDCNIVANTALRGGGLAGNSSIIDLFSTEIVGNNATVDPNDPNNAVGDLIASGAGLYCLLGGLNVRDCNVAGNIADFSGGGAYLRDVDTASFINNLINNNTAGRDGGGLSLNWFADAVIANCTFVNNATPGTLGQANNTGFGGGLFTSHGNNALVTDSIFWNNFALRGNAIAVGGNFGSDKRPSTLTVTHSLVKDATGGVWVEPGSTLNWAVGNISGDPLFATGRLDDYYLSQIASGQGRNSPAIDAGSNYASRVSLTGYTTRTDELRDTGLVDIGYHHPKAQPCRLGDIAFDGIINFPDFAGLAESWLEQSCSASNAWCRGADITTDEEVDFRDVLFLADCWLVRDTLPPTPNPSEWETEPNLVSGGAIKMEAETSLDAWGWTVEYFFDCVDGDGGCSDSGWQTSPTYTDTGLTSGVQYAYRVRARDGVGNMTEWSPVRYAGLDSTPPAPAPFIETIFASSETSITMIASTVFDESDVEYFFENTSVAGHNSGWQDDPNYTDPNLLPDTEYSYRVKARDKSPRANETKWSEEVTARTLPSPDLDPPTPNPMEWDPTQDPNGFDGRPRETLIDPNDENFGWGATMTAVVATDAGGGPVEYFFECITNSGFNSGWIDTETYTVALGRRGQGQIFRVRARDQFGNMTGWSPAERAIARQSATQQGQGVQPQPVP
jgi:subtilisin family serine protease